MSTFRIQDYKRNVFFFLSAIATEEVVTADSVDSAIQQVVSSGGQQVITIVTDDIQLSSLQAASDSMNQPIIVTMQDGRQGKV